MEEGERECIKAESEVNHAREAGEGEGHPGLRANSLSFPLFSYHRLEIAMNPRNLSFLCLQFLWNNNVEDFPM